MFDSPTDAALSFFRSQKFVVLSHIVCLEQEPMNGSMQLHDFPVTEFS